MQEVNIQLPFTLWDILRAAFDGGASLASGIWMNLTPGLRLMLVLMLLAVILLPPATATVSAGRRRYRRRSRRHRYDW